MIAAANPFTGKREQKASNGVPVGGFSVFRERKWLTVLQKIRGGPIPSLGLPDVRRWMEPNIKDVTAGSYSARRNEVEQRRP